MKTLLTYSYYNNSVLYFIKRTQEEKGDSRVPTVYEIKIRRSVVMWVMLSNKSRRPGYL